MQDCQYLFAVCFNLLKNSFMRVRSIFWFLIFLVWMGRVQAADARDDGFQPLFNGRDLSGWSNVNCAPGTFTVRDGMIVSTGIPTGVMRTEKQYENFELELEWRHIVPKGNAGLFVWSYPVTAPGVPFTRSIEVQILDGRNSESYTSHGDVFAIHGARFSPDRPHPNGSMRCLPSEWRCKPAGEWNHYRVTCNDGDIKLAVNGKVVSGGNQSVPRKGYICLEAEGSECHFRNIRIKELPSTNPESDEIAPLAEGFRSLYTGVDLTGWKQNATSGARWKAADWILKCDEDAGGRDDTLWSVESFKDFVLICDWRWVSKGAARKHPVILPNGEYEKDSGGSPREIEVLDSGDSGIYLRGSEKAELNIWSWPVGSGEVWGYRTDVKMPPDVRAAVTPRERADEPLGRWNRFVITMRGDRLTVELNGKIVLENAQLPGIPLLGPVGLQSYGSPIEFANIYVKALN